MPAPAGAGILRGSAIPSRDRVSTSLLPAIDSKDAALNGDLEKDAWGQS
jgi:hypothetical protein